MLESLEILFSNPHFEVKLLLKIQINIRLNSKLCSIKTWFFYLLKPLSSSGPKGASSLAPAREQHASFLNNILVTNCATENALNLLEKIVCKFGWICAKSSQNFLLHKEHLNEFSSEFTLMCWLRLKRSQNFLLYKEQLNGFSFECTLTCSFRLKSSETSCYVKSIWVGFHLSVPRCAD